MIIIFWYVLTYEPISAVKTLYSGSVQLDTQLQTNPILLKSYVFRALNTSNFGEKKITH